MNLITEEQQRHYEEQGFVLISGLIPPEVSANAETAMWCATGVDRHDPASWASVTPIGGTSDPDILATFTADVCAVAALLGGGDPTSYTPPSGILPINVFPQGGEWVPQAPHIDHAIQSHGHRTFPKPLRVATLTYLNDVPRHGAGTVVWPGSHKIILRLAESDPEKYALMWSLNSVLQMLDLGEPVEILSKRGDVLFYDYLCAHGGSRNSSSVPRFALARKW